MKSNLSYISLLVLLPIFGLGLGANNLSIADSLFQEAEQLQDALSYEESACVYQEAADYYEQAEAWEGYYKSQSQIAHCWWRLFFSERVVRHCNQMLSDAVSILGENNVILAEFHTILGNIYADKRTEIGYETCMRHYRKALALKEKHYGLQHPKLASAYDRLGIAHFLIDDYSGAIPHYENALSLLEPPEAANASTYADVYDHLGLIYLNLGYYTKALENFREAKRMIREVQGNNNSRVVKYLINIAEALTKLGDFAEAKLNLEEAMAIESKVGTTRSRLVANILGGLGEVYLSQNKYETAIDFYDKCLDYWDPDWRDDANAVILYSTKIGNCYLGLGQGKQANQYLEQVVRLLELYYDEDNLNWVEPLLNLSKSYQLVGDFSTAEIHLKRALRIVQDRVGDKHPLATDVKLQLAKLFLDQSLLEEALYWGDAIEKVYANQKESAFEDHLGHLESLELLANIYQQIYEQYCDLSKLEMAGSFFEKALEQANRLKINLYNQNALQAVQKRVFLLTEAALGVFYQLWQNTGQQNFIETAFSFFEKSKSDWLRSSAREQYAKQVANIPAHMVEKELSLKTELAYYRNLLDKGEHEDFQREIWQERVFAANTALGKLIAEFERKFPNYYKKKYDLSVLSLIAAQAKSKRVKKNILTYFWGDKSLHILFIGAEKISWQYLANNRAIGDQINDYTDLIIKGRNSLVSDEERLNNYQSYCKKAYQLYQRLIPTEIRENAAKGLLIVPDGPLGQFPFQTLLTNRVDTDNIDYRKLPYLATQVNLQFAFSLTLLDTPVNCKSSKAYVGFAPRYESNLTNSATTEYEELTGLVYNSTEVKEVNRILGGEYFCGRKATETIFKREAPLASTIHIAAHARDNYKENHQAAIIFSPIPEHEGEDGLLYNHELIGLPICAQLTILSACYTGRGNIRQGEGIMSLGRTFRSAGSASVLVSLWQTNDVVSKELIQYFAKHLMQEKTKSEALRKSIQDFLATAKNDEQVNPFYWGSFLLIGEDYILDKETNFLSFNWAIVGLILLGGIYLICLRILPASLRKGPSA